MTLGFIYQDGGELVGADVERKSFHFKTETKQEEVEAEEARWRVDRLPKKKSADA
jgi:hypothetical protein